MSVPCPPVEPNKADFPDENPPPVACDRITVTGGIYHQIFGEQPFEIPVRYARWLNASEQPYTRRCRVGEVWEAVDTGWITQAGLIVLVSMEGRFLQTNPTKEEEMEAAAKVIEVCTVAAASTMHDSPPEAQWLVFPGEVFYGTPAPNVKLLVRCQSGEALFTIHVMSE